MLRGWAWYSPVLSTVLTVALTMAGLRAQCEARAHRLSPVPGLQRVTPQPAQSPGLVALLGYRVRDPFGPHEPAQATPEAA